VSKASEHSPGQPGSGARRHGGPQEQVKGPPRGAGYSAGAGNEGIKPTPRFGQAPSGAFTAADAEVERGAFPVFRRAARSGEPPPVLASGGSGNPAASVSVAANSADEDLLNERPNPLSGFAATRKGARLL
jgi:hypothetical protein